MCVEVPRVSLATNLVDITLNKSDLDIKNVIYKFRKISVIIASSK